MWCVCFLHCSAPASVCVSPRCLGSILLPQHSSWLGAEVEGDLGASCWNGQGGLRQERWRLTSLVLLMQLWASEDVVTLLCIFFFSVLLVNPFSLSPSASTGGGFPFWWGDCWHEGFSFLRFDSGVSAVEMVSLNLVSVCRSKEVLASCLQSQP